MAISPLDDAGDLVGQIDRATPRPPLDLIGERSDRSRGLPGADRREVGERVFRLGLKVAAPPQAILAQLAGTCKKIPDEFAMKLKGGRTEVK